MARHLLLSGRVQGVGFRQFLCRQAGQLGVTGWVRNRSDGTVEAVVAGSEDALAALIARARAGPGTAQVALLEISEVEGSFPDFRQRPSV